jgi:hypothetical protein
MATRDIKTSVLLSLLFFIFIKFFINEKSTFCLVSNDDKNQIINNNISREEYEKAKIVIEKFNNSNK